MTAEAEVSREIAASPAAVFAAITDITRMGEWSPETHAAEWAEGFDQAKVGAVFTGHNRLNGNEWSIDAEIVDLVQDERFFFDCNSRGFVFAKWGYTIEATDAGCRVTESWEDLRPEEAYERGKAISGVGERTEHTIAGMTATLERLAAAVEA